MGRALREEAVRCRWTHSSARRGQCLLSLFIDCILLLVLAPQRRTFARPNQRRQERKLYGVLDDAMYKLQRYERDGMQGRAVFGESLTLGLR